LRTGDAGASDLDSAATAVGTDISRSQLELAAENVPDVALAQGDMVGLPFRNGSFDAVTAYHSLIHVPREQHQEAVDEFARVLADGGRLLCSEGPDEWSRTNPDWLDTGVEDAVAHRGRRGDPRPSPKRRIYRRTEWRTDDSLAEGDDANWTFFAARLEE